MIDLLDMWANQKPNQPAYTFLTDRLKKGGCFLTYKELDQHAKATSGILREHVGPGDRAVLIFPAGLEFLVAFYCCLYANLIAIPACPLAEQVDVIYHCAAEMNFISSYTTQRAVNVSGTREIIRLANPMREQKVRPD